MWQKIVLTELILNQVQILPSHPSAAMFMFNFHDYEWLTKSGKSFLFLFYVCLKKKAFLMRNKTKTHSCFWLEVHHWLPSRCRERRNTGRYFSHSSVCRHLALCCLLTVSKVCLGSVMGYKLHITEPKTPGKPRNIFPKSQIISHC